MKKRHYEIFMVAVPTNTETHSHFLNTLAEHCGNCLGGVYMTDEITEEELKEVLQSIKFV